MMLGATPYICRWTGFGLPRARPEILHATADGRGYVGVRSSINKRGCCLLPALQTGAPEEGNIGRANPGQGNVLFAPRSTLDERCSRRRNRGPRLSRLQDQNGGSALGVGRM